MNNSYFSHDSNARNDEKIIALRMKYGMEGYGIYFSILERMRDIEGYIHVKDYNIIAFDLRVNNAIIKSIVEDFGLFEFTDDGKRFYSVSFLNRMKAKDAVSEKRREAGRLGGAPENNMNASKNKQKTSKKQANACFKTSKNKQVKESKVKESKVKESKVKEREEDYPLTPFKGDVVAVGASLEVRKVEKEIPATKQENPATKQENPATKQENPAKCEDSPPEQETTDSPPEQSTDPEEVKPPWRESYDTYLAELRAAYAAAVSDEKYMEERQRYHPRLNIGLTIEKACKDFWATEAGWKHKKASKTVRIDWRQTFSKAMTFDCNKVWKTREEDRAESEQKKIIYI